MVVAWPNTQYSIFNVTIIIEKFHSVSSSDICWICNYFPIKAENLLHCFRRFMFQNFLYYLLTNTIKNYSLESKHSDFAKNKPEHSRVQKQWWRCISYLFEYTHKIWLVILIWPAMKYSCMLNCMRWEMLLHRIPEVINISFVTNWKKKTGIFRKPTWKFVRFM